MMGLGAVVLTDLMTGELRAPSNFKSALGCETVIAMPAHPGFHTMLPQTYVYKANLWAYMNYIWV